MEEPLVFKQTGSQNMFMGGGLSGHKAGPPHSTEGRGEQESPTSTCPPTGHTERDGNSKLATQLTKSDPS